MAGNVTKAAARRAADEMVKSIGAPAKRNEDVSGVVRRIDPDGTRWVQLPGDEGLTPCAENAVESMMGDDVTVRIGNHSASIVKNNTKPPDGRTSEKVDEIRAGVGKFDDLYATTATFSVLVAENATVEQIQAAQVYAESVNAQLVAAPEAQFGEIYADSATVEDITVEGQVVANIARINSAELKQLNADVATFGAIGAKYAQVDAANIDTATMREAWVDSLMVQTGLISHSGTIYELDAIQVNASKITAGTLDVERLIVTVDGEKYLVHVDAQGTAAYQKLDGNIVEDLTITTDKLVAGAVTAQKITTENIVGTGGWINLRNGTFSYVNATSGQGISWNGTTLTVNGNVTVGGSTMSLSDVASMAADAEASKVWDGTCSTAADTSEKAVTCTGLTALEDGTTILVEFSNANTANSPKLNVNALGAKDVKVGGSVSSDTNKLHWGAGAAIRFKYDGTRWVVDTPPAKFYAFCTTAAATTTKMAVALTSSERLVMQRNTEVTVGFTHAHTGHIGACLSIIGVDTNASTIYNCDRIIIAGNGNSWKDNSSITFVFTGSLWNVIDSSARKEAAEAATMATNYVTDITGGGVMVHPSDDSTSGWKIAGAIELLKSGVSYIWAGIESSAALIRVGLSSAGNVVMSSAGVDIRNGSTSYIKTWIESNVAKARVGVEAARHILLDSNGFTFMNGNTLLTRVRDSGLSIFNDDNEDMFSITLASQSASGTTTVDLEFGSGIDPYDPDPSHLTPQHDPDMINFKSGTYTPMQVTPKGVFVTRLGTANGGDIVSNGDVKTVAGASLNALRESVSRCCKTTIGDVTVGKSGATGYYFYIQATVDGVQYALHVGSTSLLLWNSTEGRAIWTK